MEPPTIALLVIVIGLPVGGVILLAGLAAASRFEPERIGIRGGSARGVVAAAVAKMAVGDAQSFVLPLIIHMKQVPAWGRFLPPIAATIRDVELEVRIDGALVSTVTEARSVRVRARDRGFELPVDANVHLPGGVRGTIGLWRQARRRGYEVELLVTGHVTVRHLWFRQAVRVRDAQHVVLGTPRPVLASAAWTVAGTRRSPLAMAQQEVVLENPYRHMEIHGAVVCSARRHRRLRPDEPLGDASRSVRLAPGEQRRVRAQVRIDELEGGREGEDPSYGEDPVVPTRLQWSWGGEALERARAADDDDQDDGGEDGTRGHDGREASAKAGTAFIRAQPSPSSAPSDAPGHRFRPKIGLQEVR